MKIAYLTSRYPAVSHTFIVREVRALRARGIDVGTFSVRRAAQSDILGTEAEEEAASTRWLAPPRIGPSVAALAWVLGTRPVLALRTLVSALALPGAGIRERLKWVLYFGEAILLAHWLVRERFDHLHCHFGNTGANTGMLAAQLARISFSMTCHGSELNEPTRFFLPEKVARAAFVVCVSKFGKARLMFVCPPEHWSKFHVVRCGLPPVSTGAAVEKEPGPPVILCVGRLSVEKGHLVLLEALARLRDEGVVARCTLVGDGPMRAQIEARADELGLTPMLTVTGALQPSQVTAFQRSADVAVLASFSEGVPVVLMEAMALGRPVVATRVGGVPELIEHGVSGLVVSPGDAQELAEALRRVLGDPQLARDLAQRGAEVVGQEFDLDASARQLEALFRGLPRPGFGAND